MTQGVRRLPAIPRYTSVNTSVEEATTPPPPCPAARAGESSARTRLARPPSRARSPDPISHILYRAGSTGLAFRLGALDKRIRKLDGAGQIDKAKGMGRNSVIQIVIVLAGAFAITLIVRRSHENHHELKRAAISHVVGDHAHAAQGSSLRSLSTPGSPANLAFAHLSVADGLSHPDVRAIARTSRDSSGLARG